ncbi:MAG: P1 family peptidase [Actinobacteria bacterium]|nr:P1 family peptidase [Actinomycetota bacterium]
MSPASPVSGPHNSFRDLGLRVGHVTRTGPGQRTGVTVVLVGAEGATAGVSVRGAAPGTRETDLLSPLCLVDRVHAIVLSGGSAFGLASADGVARALYADGIGWPMGAPGEVVPIVPAAVIFDLGRGGDFGAFPSAADGAAAYAAASLGQVAGCGSVGAGTGAQAGGLAGGLGSASAVLSDGTTVAALVVVNAIGSPVDPRTGQLYAVAHGLPGEFPDLGSPGAGALAAYLRARHTELGESGLVPGGATTIGVIATDAALDKAQCAKLADVGHDGIARAIDPAHTMLDGDTLFALSTAARPAPDLGGLFALHEAAASCVTRAIGHALLTATSAAMWPGTGQERLVESYRDAFALSG